MVKLDLSKFFPNTHREKIYQFFLQKLRVTPDVAKLLTDFTTVNYKDSFNTIDMGVEEFINIKNIRNMNHLPSGTSTSQILAYLANIDMYNEIIKYTNSQNILCSIYVDDITLSSQKPIHKKQIERIRNIITKNQHKLNIKKSIYYGLDEYKKVTGYVISPKHKLVIPNKTRYKIKSKVVVCKKNKRISRNIRNSILGSINFANMSRRGSYEGLDRKLKNLK